MAEHMISAAAKGGAWLTGAIDGFPFGIKVCDVNSGFGIGGGRVIKLYVNDKDSPNGLFAYERGWEREPSSQTGQDLLEALLRFAATLPEREIWRHGFKRERVFFVTEEDVLEVE